jgi:hypothetical protein
MPGNDSFTKILLHMEGTDGIDATGTTDSAIGQTGGAGTRSWTAPSALAVTSDEVVAKFGTTSLWDISGTVGHIVATHDADMVYGSGDWTVDFWFNRRSQTGARGLFGQLSPSSGVAANNALGAQFNSSNVLQAFVSVGSTIHTLTGSTAFTNTSWNHFALTRNGNTVTLWANGASEASTTVSGSVNNPGLDYEICRMRSGVNSLFGFIDEFRLSIGVARWTSSFTPPTEAYTEDTSAVGAASGTGAAAGVGASTAAAVGAASGTGAAAADSTGSGVNAAVGTATGAGEAFGVALGVPDVVGSCAAYHVRGRVGASYSVTGEARV